MPSYSLCYSPPVNLAGVHPHFDYHLPVLIFRRDSHVGNESYPRSGIVLSSLNAG